MTSIKGEKRYTQTHEWVRCDVEDEFTVGITDHAEHQLGDIIYVELPEVGSLIHKGKEFGVIESVKAAADLYAPLSGKIIAVNAALATDPALINKDAYERGWLIKVKPDDLREWNELMNVQDYTATLKG